VRPLRYGAKPTAGPSAASGTINEIAEVITESGDDRIAVRCDHANDAQIKALFEQVEAEQGDLDILVSQIIEGREARTIIGSLRRHKADLMIVGLHQHDFYNARLWSTAYELAQETPCSILGVN
jgi:NAD(P)-dependent dehydrogenase (short-subunit alcohol dehydrogenase family)